MVTARNTVRTFLALAAVVSVVIVVARIVADDPHAPALPVRRILVPGGTFEPGPGSVDPASPPRRRVTVAAFELDETEVTVGAYRACVTAGACTPAGSGDSCTWADDVPRLPVNCVSWPQADAYCRFAGRRLPSEAEWEWAARGADGRGYPWGAAAPGSRACWSGDDAVRKGPCEVGTHRAGDSPFGVADLSGNVAEWVADPEQAPDPAGAPDPKGKPGVGLRVTRGGSWFDREPRDVAATARAPTPPDAQFYDLGFRCARDAPRP